METTERLPADAPPADASPADAPAPPTDVAPPTDAARGEPQSDYERERGKPLPSKNHSRVQLLLGSMLLRYDDRYTSFSELTLDLDDEGFLTPDLSVYPRLEVDFTDDEIRMTEPPLLAVEILSPTQSVQDLVQKARRLLAAGVQSVWIVMTPIKAVTVYADITKPVTYGVGDTLKDPATGIEIALADVFDAADAA